MCSAKNPKALSVNTTVCLFMYLALKKKMVKKKIMMITMKNQNVKSYV